MIANNYCKGDGGGIYNYLTYANESFYINCTIVNNYAVGNGGGIFNYSTSAGQDIRNSIVHGNKHNNGVDNDIYNYKAGYSITSSQIGVVSGFSGTTAWTTVADTKSQHVTLFGADPVFKNPIPVRTTNAAITTAYPLAMSEYYRLTYKSPGLNVGDNGYITPISTYPWMEYDLAERLRIQQNVVDLGAYEGLGIYECPPTAIWQPVSRGDKTNWNDFRNWSTREVPGQCTHVYIPTQGTTFYDAYTGNYETGEITIFPLLSGSPVTDPTNPIYRDDDPTILIGYTKPPQNTTGQITFLSGAEIGRQDNLAYDKAYVQFDFGFNGGVKNPASKLGGTVTEQQFSFDHSKSSLTRNRWYFFTSPLQEVVSGDMAFGGYPRTFMNRFIASSSQTNTDPTKYPVGSWTGTFADQNVKLIPGEGFAYWMNPHTGGTHYTDFANKADGTLFPTSRDIGIGAAKGILQIPYIDNPTYVAQRRVVKHDAGTNTTTFYQYRTGYDDVVGNGVNFVRGDSVYRLNNSPVNYTLASGNAANQEVLVGNPFMTTIDFIAFYNANSTYIEPKFRIFDGTGTDSYIEFNYNTTTHEITTIPATGVSRYIAPMQGFLVKIKSNVTADTDLTFNIANLSSTAKHTSTFLRNTAISNQTQEVVPSVIGLNTDNIIRIKATNQYATSEALIGLKSTASDAYLAQEDMSKLFVQYGGAPDVFTVADSIALSMNFVSSQNIVIPIGIRTQATVSTTFELTGMNNYNAGKIEFIDVVLNKVVDITNDSKYNYTFTNTTNGVLNGRFFLNFIQKVATGYENQTDINDKDVNVYAHEKNIFVASTASNLIQTITIFDMQGRQLSKYNSVNSSYYQLGEGLPTEQFLIVSVETQNGVSRKKVILK